MTDQIFFKTENDQRIRKGEIVERQGDYYTVMGCRTSSQFTRPVLTVHVSQIIADHVSACRKERKIQKGQGAGMCIVPEESIRRSKALVERLGMDEGQLLQARAIIELRRRTVRRLAACNGIAPNATDFDFEELTSESLVATLSALRSSISKATTEQVAEFQQQLSGKTDYSKIMITVARTIKTACIRYLRKRDDYRYNHISFDDMRAA